MLRTARVRCLGARSVSAAAPYMATTAPSVLASPPGQFTCSLRQTLRTPRRLLGAPRAHTQGSRSARRRAPTGPRPPQRMIDLALARDRVCDRLHKLVPRTSVRAPTALKANRAPVGRAPARARCGLPRAARVLRRQPPRTAWGRLEGVPLAFHRARRAVCSQRTQCPLVLHTVHRWRCLESPRCVPRL